MPTEVSARRSSRDKKRALSFYDEAARLEQEKRFRESEKRSSKSLSESNVRTSLSDGMFSDNESDDMNEDESEDSERLAAAKSPRKPKTPKISTYRKSPPSPQRLRKPAKKSSVQVGTSTFHIAKSSNPKSRRSKWSLRILARKVLFEEDRNSLLEKLLNCDDESSLRKICQELINIHRDNSIACEIMLINLMFRVVGGTPSTYLPEDCELEEMGNDDWARVITDLVDDMRYCAPDYVLLCADPDGASPAKSASLSTALRQFRELYTKFWFTLSQHALEDSTGRFEIEMVRNWLNRTHELTLVAQPDIRAASVLASLQISLGVLDRTMSIRSREATQERQCKCSSGKKKEQLQFSVDGLRRNRQDLEEIVNSTFSTVFMSRYRDSNPFIRAENIMALSKMIIMRPDIYLSDKYLKYIGWTLSDKESCVRKASLLALSAPFGSKAIDLSAMSNVIRRFLPRLADCTIDVDINIQELAMSLFLQLDRANFLEDFEDDSLWAQINNRALASDTSPQVRRDALQFILNQLEAFDYDEIGHGSDKNWTKSKKASLVQSTNKNAAKQLSTLAGWVGHALTDGPVPLEFIRLELTDYIVDSLRSMSEHHSLVTNWTAMVLAAKECEYSPSPKRDKAEERAELAKEKVVFKLFSRAAHAEVCAVSPGFLEIGASTEDPEWDKQSLPRLKKKVNNSSHLELSCVILKELPDFLMKYKTESDILMSLCSLPRLLQPSVSSLPKHKQDFILLIKQLCDIFLQSNNESILISICDGLAFFSDLAHANAQDVLVQIHFLLRSLSDRLQVLFSEIDHNSKKNASMQKNSRNRGTTILKSGSENSSEIQDKEVSIAQALRRLRILFKRMDISRMINDNKGFKVTELLNVVVSGLSVFLKERQVIIEDDGDDTAIVIPKIWEDSNEQANHALADATGDTLQILLSDFAWSLKNLCAGDALASSPIKNRGEESDDNLDIEDTEILHQRSQLVEFISLCFEQYLPEVDDSNDVYSKDHIDFSNQVQTAALQTSGDLRALLPKEWSQAASPTLRACALTDDSALIGGSIRYFRSREFELRKQESSEIEDKARVYDLLLPFCRTFLANWSQSNRREAGYAMAHIVGSGKTSQQILTSLSRLVKKMNSVHLLETHMACLRTSFDDWLNSEPGDLESDDPTDDEMEAYAEAEKVHRERFELLVQQASRLSQSLGVGKVEPHLEKPLLGFCREGIRYAFSTEVMDGEEPLLPGGRLTFLSLLAKYIPWIRKSSSFREIVIMNILEREQELRNDPDYDQAHEDDLNALQVFRKSIGLKNQNVLHEKSHESASSLSPSQHNRSLLDDDSSSGASSNAKELPRNKRLRLSRGSSMGSSIYSNTANISALSPLMEEDAISMDEEVNPNADEESSIEESFSNDLESNYVKQSALKNPRKKTPRGEKWNKPLEEIDDDSLSE